MTLDERRNALFWFSDLFGRIAVYVCKCVCVCASSTGTIVPMPEQERCVSETCVRLNVLVCCIYFGCKLNQTIAQCVILWPINLSWGVCLYVCYSYGSIAFELYFAECAPNVVVSNDCNYDNHNKQRLCVCTCLYPYGCSRRVWIYTVCVFDSQTIQFRSDLFWHWVKTSIFGWKQTFSCRAERNATHFMRGWTSFRYVHQVDDESYCIVWILKCRGREREKKRERVRKQIFAILYSQIRKNAIYFHCHFRF